jgi:hypothetical protein
MARRRRARFGLAPRDDSDYYLGRMGGEECGLRPLTTWYRPATHEGQI